MTKHYSVTDLQKVIVLREQGLTVREATKAVYGRVATYYAVTTPEQRAQVYCKPPKKGSTCPVTVSMPTERSEALAAYAKNAGTTVTHVINKLVVDLLTLTPVQ